MNEIRSLDGLSGLIPLYSTAALRDDVAAPAIDLGEDQLDLSPEAQALTDSAVPDGARAARLTRIREAIARGAYLTDEKVQVALRRALADADRAAPTADVPQLARI